MWVVGWRGYKECLSLCDGDQTTRQLSSSICTIPTMLLSTLVATAIAAQGILASPTANKGDPAATLNGKLVSYGKQFWVRIYISLCRRGWKSDYGSRAPSSTPLADTASTPPVGFHNSENIDRYPYPPPQSTPPLLLPSLAP